MNPQPTPSADEYSTPIPQGATLGSSSSASPSDDYSTPIPQGATVGGSPTSRPVAGASSIDVPGNLETGALHGLAQSGAGIMGIAEKLANPSGDPNNERPWFTATKNFLESHSQNTGTDTFSRVEQGTGNVIEGLGEFLLGDEGLKGAALSDKLLGAGKLAKAIESSPRLTAVVKAGLAALSGGGVSAVKSGGDPTATLTGATLGAVAPGAASVAGKVAGKAAETVAPLVENIKAAIKPGVVQDAIQSEMRSVMNDFAQEAGVNPSNASSIRDVAHEIAGNLEGKAKQSYQALDDALGGRAQRFRDAIKNVQQKIRELNGIDADQEGAYVEKLNDLQSAHDQAMTEANDMLKSQGKDKTAKQLLDQANNDFRTSKRMLSVSRDIRGAVDDTTTRPEIAAQSQRPIPEKVDTKKLVTRLNKSYNRGYLQDALGQQRAQRLLAAANDAHATTQAAQTLRKVAIRSALVGSIPGLGVLFHYLGE